MRISGVHINCEMMDDKEMEYHLWEMEQMVDMSADDTDSLYILVFNNAQCFYTRSIGTSTILEQDLREITKLCLLIC